jgi:hypothetical protein
VMLTLLSLFHQNAPLQHLLNGCFSNLDEHKAMDVS